MQPYRNHFLFFFLIGISASFPLIVTMEQRGFYLVTSLPFFALALAALAAPSVSAAMQKIDLSGKGFKIFRIISVVLLSGAILFSALQIGKTKRNETMLHDIYLIGPRIPKGTIASTTPALWQNWEFQEYFIRHFYISLDGNGSPTQEFLISDAEPGGPNYKKINLPTLKYHLYFHEQ